MRDIYKIPPNCLINTACALHVLVRHSWGENGVLFFFFPLLAGKSNLDIFSWQAEDEPLTVHQKSFYVINMYGM